MTLIAGLLYEVFVKWCFVSCYLLILYLKRHLFSSVTRVAVVTHPSRAFVGIDVGAAAVCMDSASKSRLFCQVVYLVLAILEK